MNRMGYCRKVDFFLQRRFKFFQRPDRFFIMARLSFSFAVFYIVSDELVFVKKRNDKEGKWEKGEEDIPSS